MIGFIGSLYASKGTTADYSTIAIPTIYSSPLHMHYGSQSSLVVSWQRAYNRLTVTSNHKLSLLFTA
jgi:hypothetical protein